MTKSHESAMQSEIHSQLRETAKSKRFRADRMLAGGLDSLGEQCEKLKSLEMPESPVALSPSVAQLLKEGQKLILLCCVEARDFIDSLDTCSVLQNVNGVMGYVRSYHQIAQVVLDFGEKLVPLLLESGEIKLAEDTQKYCRSIGFRRSLANKIGEGLSAAEDLLEEDLAKNRGALRTGHHSEAVSGLAELNLRTITVDQGVSLFFLWKGTRLLRHKLLFAAVELSHEAGPWLESVEDHERIIWNTLELTEEFLAHSRDAVFLLWKDTALHLLEEAQRTTQILARIRTLQTHRSSNLMADEEEVKKALKEVEAKYMRCHHDLEYLESKMAGAVKKHLGSWETLWEWCSVTADDLKTLLAHPAGEVAELIRGLDAVLHNTWDDSGLECAETMALRLFRRLAGASLKAACDYLEQTFDAVPAPGLLLDQVTQMFCGVLLTAAEDKPLEFPGWQRWLNLANRIADATLATGYPLSSRVASCASVLAIGILVAPNRELASFFIVDAVNEVAQALSVHAVTGEDQERLEWLMPQLRAALDGFMKQEGAIQRQLSAPVVDIHFNNAVPLTAAIC